MMKYLAGLAAITAISFGVSSGGNAAPWSDNSTRYRCDGIAGAIAQPGNAAAIAPLRAIARPTRVDAAYLDSVAAALDRSARESRGDLTTADRVRLQHELLTIADALQPRLHELGSHGEHVYGRVMAYVRSIAPTASAIAALGAAEHPALSGFLGGEVVERATRSCGSGRLFHARAADGLLAYRPLRGDESRAIVAQLVAFDDAGVPHVTPLVETIELRRGNDIDAPACVVHAGDDGVLHPLTLSEISTTGDRFVRRVDDGVGCRGCHHGENTMGARDLSAEELPAIDAARYGYVHDLATSTWDRLSR